MPNLCRLFSVSFLVSLFDYYFYKNSSVDVLKQFAEWNIKNIIWDVDGTLADINHAYYCFIKNHPLFKDQFKNFMYKDLDVALPVEKTKYGAIELKTHPTLGEELDKAFCESNDYYFDRPLYYGTKKVLNKLNNLNYKQFILSAGFNAEKKIKLLNQLFTDFPFIKIDVVLHDANGMSEGGTKEQKILDLLKKYNLNNKETVLIDDRIYNIHSALNAGVHAIRFRSEFTTPLPDNLSFVPEIEDIRQIIA